MYDDPLSNPDLDGTVSSIRRNPAILQGLVADGLVGVGLLPLDVQVDQPRFEPEIADELDEAGERPVVVDVAAPADRERDDQDARERRGRQHRLARPPPPRDVIGADAGQDPD
jgi:hypothetical protein